MVDKNILYENLRFYKTRLIRTDDEHEKLILHAAIGRATVKIDQLEANEANKK